jgi:HSP20 family protein
LTGIFLVLLESLTGTLAIVMPTAISQPLANLVPFGASGVARGANRNSARPDYRGHVSAAFGAHIAQQPFERRFCQSEKARRFTKMASLSNWNPFRELERMVRRLEASPFPRFEDIEESRLEAFTPAIESYVKDGDLVVRADVPGLDPKDIDVSIFGNVLTLKGERKSEKEVQREHYLRREIAYGAFERRLTLPEGVATENVKATFKNGVLEIAVPLAKETAATKVPIEARQEEQVEPEKK